MKREEHPQQNNLLPERLPNGKFPKVKMWTPPGPGQRNGPFPRIKWRPKPPSEAPAPQAWKISSSLSDNRMSGREKVAMEKKCRTCSEQKELTRHHLIPHSWFLSPQGGRFKSIRNANANIVPLCVSCHRIVDGVRDPVGRLQKRAALRETLGTNEISFLIQLRGQEWLDSEYPRNP